MSGPLDRSAYDAKSCERQGPRASPARIYLVSRGTVWRGLCGAGFLMSQPWIVILTGGVGTRLRSLTRALYGADVPKQFAVLVGDKSLLQLTVERAARLTSFERILVIVGTKREALARIQLEPYPGVELVVQPRNLDTGPGLLPPLARNLPRDPDAHVAVLPSDHYVSDAAPLLEALRVNPRGRIMLLGIKPTAPEVEYGWIVAGERIGLGRSFRIARFIEKSVHAVAEDLFRAGALWNTFVQVGSASTYWALARRYLPIHASAFEHYAVSLGTAHERQELEQIYERVGPANFGDDLLPQADALAVIPIVGTGWSDWGSHTRVFQSLAGSLDLDLIARPHPRAARDGARELTQLRRARRH